MKLDCDIYFALVQGGEIVNKLHNKHWRSAVWSIKLKTPKEVNGVKYKYLFCTNHEELDRLSVLNYQNHATDRQVSKLTNRIFLQKTRSRKLQNRDKFSFSPDVQKALDNGEIVYERTSFNHLEHPAFVMGIELDEGIVIARNFKEPKVLDVMDFIEGRSALKAVAHYCLTKKPDYVDLV